MANESVKAEVKVTREAAYIGDFKFNFQGNLIEKYIEMKDAGKLDKYEKEVMELMAKHYAFYGQFQEENAYITRGSILRCSGGNKMNTFDILNDHGVEKAGSPLGICTDCKANENIHTFGECKKPTPEGYPERPIVIPTLKSKLPFIMHKCIPILNGSWSKTKSSKVKIWNESVGKYVDAITTGDFLVCLYGGIIEVVEIPTVNGTKGPGKEYVTASQLQAFGWKNTSDKDVATLNATLEKYGITSMDSIILFLATCGHESGKGAIALEKLMADGTTVGSYKTTERGAGYIQITWENTHKKFLKTVNDSFSGVDTATYIAQNYPWEAAAWFWSSTEAKSTAVGSLNDYATTYGSSEGVFLVTQYLVNGWPSGLTNDVAANIRDGKVSWEIKNGRLIVDGKDVSRVPIGWDDREKNYNDAVNYFK